MERLFVLVKAPNVTLTCLAVLKMKVHLGIQRLLILIVNVDRQPIIVPRIFPELQRRQCIDLNPSVEVGRNHFGEQDFLLCFPCAENEIFLSVKKHCTRLTRSVVITSLARIHRGGELVEFAYIGIAFL